LKMSRGASASLGWAGVGTTIPKSVALPSNEGCTMNDSMFSAEEPGRAAAAVVRKTAGPPADGELYTIVLAGHGELPTSRAQLAVTRSPRLRELTDEIHALRTAAASAYQPPHAPDAGGQLQRLVMRRDAMAARGSSRDVPDDPRPRVRAARPTHVALRCGDGWRSLSHGCSRERLEELRRPHENPSAPTYVRHPAF